MSVCLFSWSLGFGHWSLETQRRTATNSLNHGFRTRHSRFRYLAPGRSVQGVAIGANDVGLSVWHVGHRSVAVPRCAVYLLSRAVATIRAERSVLLRRAVDLHGRD